MQYFTYIIWLWISITFFLLNFKFENRLIIYEITTCDFIYVAMVKIFTFEKFYLGVMVWINKLLLLYNHKVNTLLGSVYIQYVM